MKSVLIIGVLFAAAVMVGCGGPPTIARVAVDGSVSLDGKPLAQALIRFVPKGEGHDAVATVTDGRFAWTESDGPTIGDHNVLVLPREPELEQAIDSINSGDRDPLKSRTVPARYQSPGILQATVLLENANRFEFALTTR